MQRPPGYSARQRWLSSIGIGAFVFAACTVLLALNAFEELELKSGYFRFKLRGESEIHPAIELVGISDADIKMSETEFPWPREFYAVMVQALAYHHAKAVALDLVFSRPKTAEGDSALREAFKQCPAAIASFFFDLGQPAPELGAKEPLQALAIRPAGDEDRDLLEGATPRWPIEALRAAGRVGFVNAPPENDGTLLRIPLVIRYHGYVFPALSLVTACRYLGVDVRDVKVKPGRYITLKPSPGKTTRIPIDKTGRMIVNFRAGEKQLAARYTSFMLALQAEMQRQRGEKAQLDLTGKFREKAVFVADVRSTDDVHVTPIGKLYGVSAHMNVLSNILSRDFMRRPGRWVTLCILAIVSLVFAGLCAHPSLLRGAVAAAALVIGYLILAWILFAHANVWIAVIAPVADMTALYTAVVTYRFFAEEREKARMRGMLTRYLSHDIVEEILQTPEAGMFEGQLKQVTVLLSDIRDFTTITEELGARETVAMLNDYFDAMVKIVLKYEGGINQFVGDELLATWGAPLERPTDPLNAVKAALEMRNGMATLMKSRQERGLKTFAIGIGINLGETKVGNIGAAEHMDYAVIGDTINYAARLEALTKKYRSDDCVTPILISQSTYERVRDHVDVTAIGKIPVKGKTQVSMVYLLNGLKSPLSAKHGDLD
ncbi:MAG: adenylate/guanylate cyclase domain-containing protein [Planctomycetes bacterium]|nr:adenylate/guanylate cyclase domain-containing protein [Planctomycetota bacterium]